MTGRRPAWLDWQDGKFSINADKAAVVRRIFEDVASHAYGLEVMSRKLNKEKVPTLIERKGEAGWHNWTINNILQSRSAYGEFQPMRRIDAGKREPVGEPIAGYYPAVVTRDLFNRAQQARALNRGSGGPKTNCVPNMLTGRVSCAQCEGVIRVRTNRRRSNSYICDTAYRRMSGCTNNTFNAVHWVEKGAMDGVLMFNTHPGMLDGDHSKAIALREEAAELGGRIETARQRMTRLIDAMADDPISEVVTRVRDLGKQIEAWEARKLEAQNECGHVSGRATIGEQIAAVQALRDAAYCDDYDEREAARSKLSMLLRQAVTSVKIGKDRVSHVSCSDGAIAFQITAGELHDMEFLASVGNCYQGVTWPGSRRDMKKPGRLLCRASSSTSRSLRSA